MLTTFTTFKYILARASLHLHASYTLLNVAKALDPRVLRRA